MEIIYKNTKKGTYEFTYFCDNFCDFEIALTYFI